VHGRTLTHAGIMPNEPAKRKRSPHKRLTAEQVKQGWLLGDYTASGYLFHLIGALRRDGWQLLITDVDAFCEKWEISRASFYRAKAKLVLQGRIGEEIQGKLKLWVQQSSEVLPFEKYSDCGSLNSETANLNFENLSLNSETANLTSETAIDPKPASNGYPDNSPDLLIRSSTDLSQSHPPNDNPEREVLNDKGKPIKTFRDWLLRRANELPTKPALITKWVNTQAQDPDVQEEFLKFYKGSKITHVPLPVEPPQNFQPEPQEMTQQARLEKYLALWQTPILRRTVTEQIQVHPEWGLILTDDGPAFALEVAEPCP
jgi:hypothetical protein